MGNRKGVFPPYLTIAFVWFATHFGGGFSSGRQVVQFYTRFGWYAIFMPLIAVAIMAMTYYYASYFSVVFKTFDYRKWAVKYYEPLGSIGGIIFEILYVGIVILATSVAFATGGSTLWKVWGIPYVPSTILVAIVIFLIVIFGADTVRASSSLVSVIVIIGMLAIYGSAIYKNFPQLSRVIQTAHPPGGFWKGLWNAIVYAGFQSILIGSFVSVVDILKSRKEVFKAFLAGYIINGAILTISSIGILSFYPAILKEAVPSLYVAKFGLPGNLPTYIVAFLILLAVISTGVTLVYGGAKRVVDFWVEKIGTGKGIDTKERSKYIIVTGIYVIVTWAIALAGLIPLIAKGYGTVGYLAIPFIIIPVLYKGFRHGREWEKKAESPEA